MEESENIDIASQMTLMRSLALSSGGLHAWQLAQLKNYIAFVLDGEFKEVTIGYDNKDFMITFFISLKKGQKLPKKSLFVKKCECIKVWIKHLLWDTMKVKVVRGKKELYFSK